EREAGMRRAQAAVLLPMAVSLAIEPLTGVGLEPVVFKGPALAARYPSPGLRPMDDLDVLPPAAQHDRGVSLLLRAGRSVVARPGRPRHAGATQRLRHRRRGRARPRRAARRDGARRPSRGRARPVPARRARPRARRGVAAARTRRGRAPPAPLRAERLAVAPGA